MLPNIATFFLFFSNDTLIIPLLIIGYVWLDQKVFFHAICLILVSILLNSALKVTFQIPLSPELGMPGFAFPSGHMQSSIAIYGWLMIKTKNIVCRIIIITLLIGIGLSLVQLGYHNYFDILGGIFFASLLIFSYSFFLRSTPQILPIILISLATFLMFYHLLIHQTLKHLWSPYYALLGVLLAEKLVSKKITVINIQSKIIATIFCLTIFVILLKTTDADLPGFLKHFKLLLLGFSLPFSTYLPSYINKHIKIYGDRS